MTGKSEVLPGQKSDYGECARQDDNDVLQLDYRLGGMNGNATLREVR